MTKENILCVKKEGNDSKYSNLKKPPSIFSKCHFSWVGSSNKILAKLYLSDFFPAFRFHVFILHCPISCKTFCSLIFQRYSSPSLRSQRIITLRSDLTFHLISPLKTQTTHKVKTRRNTCLLSE